MERIIWLKMPNIWLKEHVREFHIQPGAQILQTWHPLGTCGSTTIMFRLPRTSSSSCIVYCNQCCNLSGPFTPCPSSCCLWCPGQLRMWFKHELTLTVIGAIQSSLHCWVIFTPLLYLIEKWYWLLMSYRKRHRPFKTNSNWQGHDGSLWPLALPSHSR